MVIVLHHNEKAAFWKFFITYFVSVAVLILFAGFFYFGQMKNSFLKFEEFSLIEYARHIKMHESLAAYDKQFKYNLVDINKRVGIRNFQQNNGEFIKLLPTKIKGKYLQVTKPINEYEQRVFNLKERIILFQVILLIFFASLSYWLARNALKPLHKSISTLDKFAKDLIHDLNTPVTSIKLNMRLLEKREELQGNKVLQRLQKSVHNISELHENLNILLQEETFMLQEENICQLVYEVVEIEETLYRDIIFKVECRALSEKVNAKALKQILQNIISNACKYNKKEGRVHIYTKANALYIEDSGKGIAEPERIFERSYSAEHSSGIGLDIVKRLAYAMNITIKVQSSANGSCFSLHF